MAARALEVIDLISPPPAVGSTRRRPLDEESDACAFVGSAAPPLRVRARRTATPPAAARTRDEDVPSPLAATHARAASARRACQLLEPHALREACMQLGIKPDPSVSLMAARVEAALDSHESALEVACAALSDVDVDDANSRRDAAQAATGPALAAARAPVARATAAPRAAPLPVVAAAELRGCIVRWLRRDASVHEQLLLLRTLELGQLKAALQRGAEEDGVRAKYSERVLCAALDELGVSYCDHSSARGTAAKARRGGGRRRRAT